tara:strand:- start:11 stop:700 length:690 start_codon:yes stop_codon:yes gene_type:complete
MKKCSKCKVEKELTDFNKDKQKKDGLKGDCKSCKKEYDKEHRKANKEQIKEYNKKRYHANKEYHKEYYVANKERIKEYCKEYSKKHYEANKERIKEYCKEYKKANKERLNEYLKERRKVDPLYKMKGNLRCRTLSAFKNKGYCKTSKTQEMLGVNWEVCKAHIERQFTKGMTWDNSAEWHIDHIIPLASANTEEELKKLCHYSNLQPLWAIDNLMKSAKINGQQNKFRF